MRILIGIPTAGDPTPLFLKSLADLHLPPQIEIVGHLVVTGNFVPGQREVILRRAFAQDIDAVIMFDDDMILPRHTLHRLVDGLKSNPRTAIVGGLYYSRDGKQPIAVNRWHSHDIASSTVPAFSEKTPVQVDGVGFGCVALRMAAVTELSLPIFHTQILIDMQHHHVSLCNEDYLLCERLRKAHWSVILDPGLRCGHYDRRSGTISPTSWEQSPTTDHERMLVVTGEGDISLTDEDVRIPCIHEELQTGRIEYIFR